MSTQAIRPGKNYSPWRIPCSSGSNAAPVLWFGAMYSQGDPATSESIFTYNNTVPNWTGSSAIPPYEKLNPGGGCGTPPDCAMSPCGTWIGTNPSSNQYTLVGGQANTIPTPTYVSSSIPVPTVCRKSGQKSVAAQRFWHGVFGWNSHDIPGGCASVICTDELTDCLDNPPTTASWVQTTSQFAYEPYQGSPDQTKYLNYGVSANLTVITTNGPDNTDISIFAQAGGGTSVEASSGIISSTLSTAEQDYASTHDSTGSIVCPSTQTKEMSNGVGWILTSAICASPVTKTFYNGNGGTVVDGVCGIELHCAGLPKIPIFYRGLADPPISQIISDWNTGATFVGCHPGLLPTTIQFLPPIENNDSYGGSAVENDYVDNSLSVLERITTLTISFSRFTNSSGSFFTCTVEQTAVPASPSSGNQENDHYTFTGTWVLSGPNTAAEVYGDACGLLGAWNLADDIQYPFRTDGMPQIAPLVSRNEKQGEVSPIQGFLPHTINDLRAAASDINGNGPYSTCSSGSCNYNPMGNDCNGRSPTNVSYSGCCAWIPTYSQTPWFDPAAYSFFYSAGQDGICFNAAGIIQIYDGSPLGVPLASDHQKYFDFNYIDWTGCPGSPVEPEIRGYGASVDQINANWGTQVPLCATQVTDALFAIATPPYAWAVYNDPTVVTEGGLSTLSNARGVVLYKYAEVREAWPSENYYRPAGNDAYVIDETRIVCVDGLSGAGPGATFTSTDYNGDPVTIPDSSGIWGGSSVGGFFNISVGGSTVTLGTQFSTCPSDWSLPSGDEGTAFGPLRFSGAPSLLGPQTFGIIGNTSGSMLSGSWSNAQTDFDLHISASEQIDIMDINYNIIASNITATRIDDSTFVMPSGSYKYAYFAQIHGAPAYSWSDTLSKGNYIYADWTFDFRTNGEAARLAGVTDCSGGPAGSASVNLGYSNANISQECIGQSPCCPSVFIISPNGESYPNNSITYPFPSSFTLDERYSSRWQAIVLTAQPDIYWQTPHRQCGLTDGGWSGDNAYTCPADSDTDTYYQGAPLVEPMQAIPGGAPALPSGVTIGYVVNATGNNVLNPPTYIGCNSDLSPSQGFFPFMARMNICNSIQSSCRFPYNMDYPPC